MCSPQLVCENIVKKFKQRYPSIAQIPGGVDYPPEPEMGDVAIALPMRAAGVLERAPLDIADELADEMAAEEVIAEVRVEKPGFVNCVFSDEFLLDRLNRVLEKGRLKFPNSGRGESILLEFVSANPTGPLHVGHGRGAVYGDVLARLFDKFGYDVQREYYVNDGGGQIEKLGESLRLRVRESKGEEVEFDSEHYRGDYLRELVEENELTGQMETTELAQFGKKKLLNRIFLTLEKCRINFDSRVHESEIATSTAVNQLISRLDDSGVTYRKEGALFLKTSAGGDDKDRVLLRGNGEPTYFANDLVYHLDKYERSFDHYLDVWGHDHHGYQKRLEVGLDFLDCDPERFEIELYQLVNLYRGGEPLAMSTREGEFVPLADLIEEVGVDPVRFNFLTQNHDSPLDFDIEVATEESEENPVYYVQYAHTRLAGILRKADDKFKRIEPAEKLSEAGHKLLVRALDLPHLAEEFLDGRQPHRLTFWLRDLARQFHTYYTHHRVINEAKPAVSGLRLRLVKFLKVVFETGLDILDVTAPEKM